MSSQDTTEVVMAGVSGAISNAAGKRITDPRMTIEKSVLPQSYTIN
jgi:hypothetical protein